MRRSSGLVAVMVLFAASISQAGPRLERIQTRGFLACGVEPTVAGFAEVDAQGRYRGLDVDVCRALSAAIFGTPDNVKYVPVLTVAGFLQADEIDVVSRRLTWELQREGPLGLLFGPITFYDSSPSGDRARRSGPCRRSPRSG